MNKLLRVCCLPLAGGENPYQNLMMAGLRGNAALDVRHGAQGKLFAAVRTVLRHRPDVIHYDWIHRYFLRRHRVWTWIHAPIFILELVIVRRIFRCRIVWTMHNLVTHDAGARPIELWVRRRFARLCDWIRVFDEATINRGSELLGVQKSLFRVVPEGSYIDHYPNVVNYQMARRRLGIGSENFVLLYFGQIRPYKGIENLLDAFESVRESNWTLLVAGFPLDERYAHEIRERSSTISGVKLYMEFIADEDIQIFFNATDVVVLPFKKVENSGTAILAMGFGKPVVAPRLGVLRRRLQQQDQILYEPGRLDEALTVLTTLKEQQLVELGERNRHAVSQHAWEDFGFLFVEKNNFGLAPSNRNDAVTESASHNRI